MIRRWFQIHLSTAVVLMLCAGGLLWVNVEKGAVPYSHLASLGIEFDDSKELEYRRGWPFVFQEKSLPDWGHGPFFYWLRLAGNVAISLVIVVCAAFACELVNRRLVRKSPA